MTAYMVFICKNVRDISEMEAYWDAAPASLQGRDVQSVVSYPPFEVIEGDMAVEGITMLEFPTADAARDWYNSPAYAEALPHRLRGADYVGILFEGSKSPRERRLRNSDVVPR